MEKRSGNQQMCIQDAQISTPAVPLVRPPARALESAISPSPYLERAARQSVGGREGGAVAGTVHETAVADDAADDDLMHTRRPPYRRNGSARHATAPSLPAHPSAADDGARVVANGRSHGAQATKATRSTRFMSTCRNNRSPSLPLPLSLSLSPSLSPSLP